MDKRKVNISILNYNGKDLLQRYLFSVVEAAKKSKHDCRVSVIDNKSSDGSVEFVKLKFPDVQVHVADKNEVLCSFNAVLKELSSDIVIMLNNDIEVKEDFIDFLIEPFNDPDVFFVAPRLLNFDNTFNGGKSFLKFKFGLLQNEVDYKNAEQAANTHSIATGAFRRETFVALGGFDRLYIPGIWEEVDLCYRALLLGKKGYYEPRSIIWHQESSTFNKVYGKKKKLILAHRNMFLFIWKNVTDPWYFFEHILFLIPRLVYSVLSGKPELLEGFLCAISKIHLALRARLKNRQLFKNRKLKDRDIIK